MPIECPSRKIGNVVVLTPVGRVDQSNAAEFGSTMVPYVSECKGSESPLILDFSQLEYISSAGLRELMIVGKRVHSQHGDLAIAGLQPLVREVFQISRFDTLFKIYDTVDTAVATLK